MRLKLIFLFLSVSFGDWTDEIPSGADIAEMIPEMINEYIVPKDICGMVVTYHDDYFKKVMDKFEDALPGAENMVDEMFILGGKLSEMLLFLKRAFVSLADDSATCETAMGKIEGIVDDAADATAIDAVIKVVESFGSFDFKRFENFEDDETFKAGRDLVEIGLSAPDQYITTNQNFESMMKKVKSMVDDIFESDDITKMGKLGKKVLTIMQKYDAGNAAIYANIDSKVRAILAPDSRRRRGARDVEVAAESAVEKRSNDDEDEDDFDDLMKTIDGIQELDMAEALCEYVEGAHESYKWVLDGITEAQHIGTDIGGMDKMIDEMTDAFGGVFKLINVMRKLFGRMGTACPTEILHVQNFTRKWVKQDTIADIMSVIKEHEDDLKETFEGWENDVEDLDDAVDQVIKNMKVVVKLAKAMVKELGKTYMTDLGNAAGDLITNLFEPEEKRTLKLFAEQGLSVIKRYDTDEDRQSFYSEVQTVGDMKEVTEEDLKLMAEGKPPKSYKGSSFSGSPTITLSAIVALAVVLLV